MRKVLYVSSGLLFILGFSSVLGSAQCTEGFTELHFHCDGPGGCHGDVYPQTPEESEYGVVIEPSPLNCCGQLFSNFTAGGGCNPGIMKKPGVREEVIRLAATADVLVADCKGRYVPYNPPAFHEPATRRLELADEHVLR